MKTTILLALMVLALLGNATGTFTLLEVNPQHGTQQSAFSDSSKNVYGAGDLSNIAELNGKLYMAAQDTIDRVGLWATDGTVQGTVLVTTSVSQIGNMIKVGNNLVFIATDNSNWDFDLFATDGTAGGTQKIAELNLGWNNILSTSVLVGDKLFFTTPTGLMCTNGKVGGTDTLLPIPQTCSLPPSNFCQVNGMVYFTMSNSQGALSIWRTDGTPQNTVDYYDLNTDTVNLSWVQNMMAFNGQLLLVGSGNVLSGIFLMDVAHGGQPSLINIPGANGDFPASIRVWNNQLFFTAYNGNASNMYLYQMRAGETSPQIIPSLTGVPVSNSHGLSFANSAVYFVGDNPQEIHWASLADFSHHVITMPAYSMPNYLDATSDFLTGAGGKIFFPAYETSTGKQVFMESDGTNSGTIEVMPQDANTEHPFTQVVGCGIFDVFDFKMFGNKVVVPSNFNDAGRELWLYQAEDLTSGIITVEDKVGVQVFPNPTSGYLNFTINDAGNQTTFVTVTNINGEIILQKTFEGETSSVDVSALASGNYCVSFLQGAKVISTKKFSVVK